MSDSTDRSKRTRRRFLADEKVAILRKHFLEGVPVSDVCDQLDIHPTLFYRWQKQFFENGSAAFTRDNGKNEESAKDRKIAALEAKLQAKNEVIAELMEENVRAKKENGEL